MQRRVLVIDDAEDVRELLETVLRGEGCEVKAVFSRDEALAVILAGWRPDLVLLDCNMPGLPVEAFIQRLTECQSTALPRIVLMTAAAEVNAKAKQLGIPEILHKPFNPYDVLDSIAACDDTEERILSKK